MSTDVDAEHAQHMVDSFTYRCLTLAHNVKLHFLSQYNGKHYVPTETEMRAVTQAFLKIMSVVPYDKGNVTIAYPYTQDGTFAVTCGRGKEKLMVIDRSAVFPSVEQRVGRNVYFTESARNVSLMEYVAAHEWGHVIDPTLIECSDDLYYSRGAVLRTLFLNGKYDPERFVVGMSGYGRDSEDEHEAYAEAFADFFLSRGNSRNYTTNVYADYENWQVPSDLTKTVPADHNYDYAHKRHHERTTQRQNV